MQHNDNKKMSGLVKTYVRVDIMHRAVGKIPKNPLKCSHRTLSKVGLQFVYLQTRCNPISLASL